MSEILIRTYEGFTIVYDPYAKKFIAKKGEIKLEEKSEEKLVELIKAHLRDLRKFKPPLDVIKISDDLRGKITSRADLKSRFVWFSYIIQGESKHTKELLLSLSWATEYAGSQFVQATPKNLKILAEILKIQQRIEAAQKEIEMKRESYEQPITEETLEKQAEGEDPAQ